MNELFVQKVPGEKGFFLNDDLRFVTSDGERNALLADGVDVKHGESFGSRCKKMSHSENACRKFLL